MKVKRICKYCGGEFYLYSSETKRGRGKFCSWKCMGQWMSQNQKGKNNPSWKGGLREYQCELCKKIFKRKPANVKYIKHLFCSSKCHGRWISENKSGENSHCWKGRKVAIICYQCAKIFISDFSAHRIFCSGKCSSKYNSTGESNSNWRGGLSLKPYGIEFNNELKEQIRKRDNYICQQCGYVGGQLDRKLHIHHIDYNKQNNKPENLISLCCSCHAQTNYSREDWTKYFQRG